MAVFEEFFRVEIVKFKFQKYIVTKMAISRFNNCKKNRGLFNLLEIDIQLIYFEKLIFFFLLSRLIIQNSNDSSKMV